MVMTSLCEQIFAKSGSPRELILYSISSVGKRSTFIPVRTDRTGKEQRVLLFDFI